ncbi:MAG: mechanosensitive ion channel family protein [Clostridia bacterium]|nr:mechanosensitive ion channel family protein [Clostridia bacterium]
MKFKDIYETAEKILSNNIVKSVLVIALAFLLYKIITALLDARVKHLKKLDRKKSQTYLHLVNSALKYAILVVAFFMLLSVNNVNITSMIAGLGIAGIILGVAVQDALKDIIRGFDIVSDDYFKVGDLVEYKGIEGIVLEIGIKTTKIKSISTENIISAPNRDIDDVALVSKFIYLNIPLPYELPQDEAKAVIEEICKEIEKAPEVKACSNLGVNNLDESDIKHLIKIECKNNLKKLQIRRNALGTVLSVLESHSIAVPYKQIDIHTK